MGIKKSKQENHTKTSQETQNTNNNIQRLEEYSHMMNTENSETLNPTCQRVFGLKIQAGAHCPENS